MPFLGDDAALTGRMQESSIGEVANQEGYIPRLHTATVTRVDEPPDPSLLGGMPYVLTGEYYFDDVGMQHCQLWLWISDSGALVLTDELVAEDVEEAEGYLPALVRWIFSQLAEDGPEEEAAESEEATETEEGEQLPAGGPGAFKGRLYLGLRGGAALGFQMVRSFGEYEGGTGQSFGGEAAVTVEYRPWRYMGFQAEGIFVLDSFGVYRLHEGVHTKDRYWDMSMLFPLFVKVPFDLEVLRPSVLVGAYYILPLRKTMGGETYRDRLKVPLGVMAGFDLGFRLDGPWGGLLGHGEFYGGLRYGIDLGLTAVEGTDLRYTRNRVVLSLGYRIWVGAKSK
jgi:hypothetical protein